MRIGKREWTYNFAICLYNILKDYRVTQHDLSQGTGISQCTISDYLQGKYCPSATSFMAICQYLNVDYIYFLNPDPRSSLIFRYDYYDNPINEYNWAIDFSFAFKALLAREECSQKELSRATGISQGLLSKYTKGITIPSAYAVLSIIDYICAAEGGDILLDLGRVVLD